MYGDDVIPSSWRRDVDAETPVSPTLVPPKQPRCEAQPPRSFDESGCGGQRRRQALGDILVGDGELQEGRETRAKQVSGGATTRAH